MSAPLIVGPEYLAPLLHKEIATIKSDARRKPESLPPRLLIPGCPKLLWLESDVLAWLQKCRTAIDTEPKPKRGRPSQVYLQGRQALGGNTA